MFSNQAIWVPHDGQWLRPMTIDSPRGTRWATTVAKLPKINPRQAAIKM
jgi:hypothetical protein